MYSPLILLNGFPRGRQRGVRDPTEAIESIRKDNCQLSDPQLSLRQFPFDGFGLGLALVRQLAKTLGGSVELESREGDGSTFRVRFPPLDRSAAS